MCMHASLGHNIIPTYLQFNCDPRFYIGHTPVLVVGNPEMVKEITIKQSANFMDRSVSTASNTWYSSSNIAL